LHANGLCGGVPKGDRAGGCSLGFYVLGGEPEKGAYNPKVREFNISSGIDERKETFLNLQARLITWSITTHIHTIPAIFLNPPIIPICGKLSSYSHFIPLYCKIPQRNVFPLFKNFDIVSELQNNL
jgi:hypothetical protein